MRVAGRDRGVVQAWVGGGARRWVRAGGVLVVCALAGAVVARADAEPPAVLDMEGGGAWVASSTVGQMTLIDGGSAEVVASVAVGEPDVDLTAVQDGMVGYGIDRDLGTVTRVDPATFTTSPPVAVIDDTEGQVSAHPAGDVVYVVDEGRGRVGVADATAVASLKGDVVSLAEPVGSAVVDDTGRLWTLGAGTGDLTWFDRTDRTSRRGAVEDPEGAELVVIDGHAALVERAGRTVRALDSDGGDAGDACIDIDPADTSVVVGGSPASDRLYVVSGEDGILRVSDLGDGECGQVAIEIADRGSELGAPTEAQHRVFIPDYSRGRVVIVDLDRRDTTTTGEILTPGTTFELFTRDGIVFYNDPASERAGVIDPDGTTAEVAKYDPDNPGEGLDDRDDDDPLPGETTGTGPGEAGDAPAGGDGTDAADAVGGDDPADEPSAAPSAGSPADTADPGAPSDDHAPDEPGGPSGPIDPDDPGGPGPGGDQPDGLIEIQANPSVLAGDEIELTVVATEGGELSGVAWDFGDGQTGDGETVTHTWEQAADYVVAVTATVASGDGEERASDARTITVQDRPPSTPLDVAFSADPTTVEVGEQVTFVNDTTGDPTSWQWTFPGAVGEGTSGERNPPAQVWNQHGDFTVTLTATRGDETDTHTVDITVLEPEGDEPVLGAIGLSGATPYDDLTTYTISATITGTFTSCAWVVDGGAGADCGADGTTGAAVATIDRRFAAGDHTIELQVRWGRDRVTSTSRTIQVETPPVIANFTVSPAEIEVGTPVTFHDQSGGSPASWEWSFQGATGSGSSTERTPPAQTWAAAGEYAVTLTVRRGAAVDSVTVPVTVQPEQGTPPVINVVAIDAPEPWNDETTYEIVSTGFNFGFFVLTCTWFVDGVEIPCTTIPPHFPELFEFRATHRFTPGEHTIQLVVGWGTRGRTVSSSLTVQIDDA